MTLVDAIILTAICIGFFGYRLRGCFSLGRHIPNGKPNCTASTGFPTASARHKPSRPTKLKGTILMCACFIFDAYCTSKTNVRCPIAT